MMMSACVRLATALLIVSMVAATSPIPGAHVQDLRQGLPSENGAPKPSSIDCTWRYFEQQLDHFSEDSRTFRQRYCMYDAFWRPAHQRGFRASASSKGPIFFYTGNESPLEIYINNTGLMWEAGERMGALLVFVEHRYEPASVPQLVGNAACFAYATSAQALQDYVAVIKALKREFDAPDSPVIAFGGSYGGMLAGWIRMKYPDVVTGAIAASAPVWGLAAGMTRESLDYSAQAVGRGLSSFGGATDRCYSNIRAFGPIVKQIGQSKKGLELLGEAVGACSAMENVDELIAWAYTPWFQMAEGNYPFASTYITSAVGPGTFPLPAWPLRVACQSLDKDFGVQYIQESTEDVEIDLRMGDLQLHVSWDKTTGNGNQMTEQQIRASGVLEFAAGLKDAVNVWYNVTKDLPCSKVAGSASDAASPVCEPVPDTPKPSAQACPSCPPCDGCPPCPVSQCNAKANDKCSPPADFTVPKTWAWDAATANEDLNMHNLAVRGVGRDMYWPPTAPRNYTVSSVVGKAHLCKGQSSDYDSQGLFGAPTVSDPWSDWLNAYYRSTDLSVHSNIVWSNGALDPWSGAGVYPPGGGPTGPLVQNITADGSQVSLVIDLGAHHLDLFFAHPEDPPAVVQARQHEEQLMRRWCQEAYNAAAPRATGTAPHLMLWIVAAFAGLLMTAVLSLFAIRRRPRHAARAINLQQGNPSISLVASSGNAV